MKASSCRSTGGADRVGIVTTSTVCLSSRANCRSGHSGHDNFQNGQAFLSGGGGAVAGTGSPVRSWNLNPWFVQVEQTPMTEVPIGHVGVVISYVGKAHEDISGLEFTHGDLVNAGHKGCG